MASAIVRQGDVSGRLGAHVAAQQILTLYARTLGMPVPTNREDYTVIRQRIAEIPEDSEAVKTARTSATLCYDILVRNDYTAFERMPSGSMDVILNASTRSMPAFRTAAAQAAVSPLANTVNAYIEQVNVYLAETGKPPIPLHEGIQPEYVRSNYRQLSRALHTDAWQDIGTPDQLEPLKGAQAFINEAYPLLRHFTSGDYETAIASRQQVQALRETARHVFGPFKAAFGSLAARRSAQVSEQLKTLGEQIASETKKHPERTKEEQRPALLRAFRRTACLASDARLPPCDRNPGTARCWG